MTDIKQPAPAPCGTCPYRRDVPSGVWSEEEYDKLPAYDFETFEQPPSVFLCHQQSGRLCAGWVACHDMAESFGLRLAASSGMLSLQAYNAALDFSTDVDIFESGAEAAEHGRREIEAPPERAVRAIQKLTRKRT